MVRQRLQVEPFLGVRVIPSVVTSAAQTLQTRKVSVVTTTKTDDRMYLTENVKN